VSTDSPVEIYGDPCRQCGYRWSIARNAAVALVAAAPSSFSALLAGDDGRARHPDLGWTVTGYVCHVADNLRIWGERLVGAACGGSGVVSTYDETALAAVRRYETIAIEGALWSLGRAVADWQVAVALATEQSVVLHHPDRGTVSVAEVVRANAHDVAHHGWDIRRSLETAG
jgi:hypothetical protein